MWCRRLFVRRGTMVLAGWLVIASRIGDSGSTAFSATYRECAVCHMLVADLRFAVEVAAPSGESRLFDDVACLESFARQAGLGAGAQVFVADHRTGERIPVERAFFTIAQRVTGPMGSPILAHESALSRAADPDAADGRAVDLAAVPGAAPRPRAAR